MEHELLTVKDAAKLIKVNTTVIDEMINSGVFSVVKQGRSVKVDRRQIEEWLANLTEAQHEKLAARRTMCRFQDYFHPQNVLMSFKAENKFEAIAEMSKFAKELKLVRDNRWLYNVVVAREELVSTAVGRFTAFLHPRHVHPTKIKTPSVLYGRHPEGIDFDAPDNQPVRHFFMLLLHDDKQHLFSLSFLSKFIQNDENLKKLDAAETPEEIYNLVTALPAEGDKKA